jgi:hypothetical protein
VILIVLVGILFLVDRLIVGSLVTPLHLLLLVVGVSIHIAVIGRVSMSRRIP